MGEAATRRNEVRTQRWLFICSQEFVAAPGPAEIQVTLPRSAIIARPSELVLIGASDCGSFWYQHCWSCVSVD
jgi:hypothetical protein